MAEFEIKVHIRDESELYHPFDIDRLTLNTELLDYIEGKYGEKNWNDTLVLRVSSETPIDEERLSQAFHRPELSKLSRSWRLASLKQLRLFLIGLIFIAAGISLTLILKQIVLTVITTVGTFAVWEATNIWIIRKPSLRMERRRLERLRNTKLIVE